MSITDTDRYLVNYNSPGKVFIFANITFNRPEFENLDSAYKDIKKIEEVFGEMHYEVKRFCDKTSIEMIQILKELSKSDFSQDSCVVIFIDSHGDYNAIFGTDCEKVFIREFFDCFKKNDTLKNKPKLFFVDACRGSRVLKKQSENLIDIENFSKVEEESDIFIGYATIKNHISLIGEDGSKFIQELCTIIKNDNKEIDHIIRTINSRIAFSEKQIANVDHSLRKFFYFKSSSDVHQSYEKREFIALSELSESSTSLESSALTDQFYEEETIINLESAKPPIRPLSTALNEHFLPKPRSNLITSERTMQIGSTTQRMTPSTTLPSIPSEFTIQTKPVQPTFTSKPTLPSINPRSSELTGTYLPIISSTLPSSSTLHSNPVPNDQSYMTQSLRSLGPLSASKVLPRMQTTESLFSVPNPSSKFDGYRAFKSLSNIEIWKVVSEKKVWLKTFVEIKNNTYVDLSNKNLVSIDNTLFSGFNLLTEISLSNNRLTSLPHDIFRGLNSIKQINISYNKLTNIPHDIFNGLSDIQKIYLGSNNLTTIPHDIFNGLKNVQMISLWNNNLTSIPHNIFNGLINIREISLNSNKLTDIPNDIFTGLDNLKEISLSNNKLTEVPHNTFKGLRNIRKIWLYGNQLNGPCKTREHYELNTLNQVEFYFVSPYNVF